MAALSVLASPFAGVNAAPEQALISGQASTASLSSCMSRQSSVESFGFSQQSGSLSRRESKAINARLMAAHTPQEIFAIVVEHLPELDAINVTAALQRLAKFLSFEDCGGRNQSLKEAVLSSPVFKALAAMMVDQCNSGLFNAQSTANAWWAVAKLHATEHPASVEMVGALENALIACLAGPSDATKLNAQGVSSVWYSCGRLASDGYAPSPVALQLLWDRTHKLALSFDSQGIANILWAFGQLRKKHGEGFPVRPDVLASLQFVVCRIAPSFAVQGLSSATVGCSNLGPILRPVVLPLVQALVAEAGRRVWQFNLQAMANMASAISRMGPELLNAGPTRFLLAAFDVHAVGLPPAGHKPQEAATLCAALKACGVGPVRFSPAPSPGDDPLEAAPAGQQPRAGVAYPPPLAATARGLRDATNGGSWLGPGSTAATGFSSSSSSWAAAPASCGPTNPLASLAGLQPPPAGYPGQQQHYARLQQQYPPPPPRMPGAPAPPPHMLVLPLAGAPTLSISQYSALAQQLVAAGRAPSPHHLPQPVLVAPYAPLPLPQAGAAVQGGYPPRPGSSANSAGVAPTTSADPAHLQRILQLLQSLKLQAAAAPAAGVPLAG
ncbi:hypothetical protein ABPG75_010662 [Micractinium tetrahymenae]